MSTHRDLLNAQQALNEAIDEFIADNLDSYGNWAADGVSEHEFPSIPNLRRRFQEWDALRKQFDGDRPAVARDTSIAAAKNPRPPSGLRRRVVEAVVAHFKLYGCGLTTDELEVRFKRTHQSVSSAVSDMDRKGWILDSKERRPTRSGCKAIVWKPSSLALDLIEGEH